ncbi:MAG: glycosyltransferase [Rickettsiales bacterium]|jgi:glycosyltransferase involved in cell wall biosynthesis|nr:glycosyltransferase [Rickettsiales bacterium]
MIPNPLISVLIPTYNREKYIAEAIESVLAQDYRPIEIIVVDDGSMDNTKEIVKQYDKKIVKYFYQKNKGIPGARNACLAKAKGEYIAWLDSDDYYLPDKLTAQMNYMREHPDCEIVFTKYENFLENEEVKNNEKAKNIIEREKKVEYKTCLASSLARKSFYKKVGKFSKKYKIGEDDFLFLIARNLNINLDHFINIYFYRRRIHNGNSLIFNKISDGELISIRKKIVSGICRRNFLEKNSKKMVVVPAVSIITPVYNTAPYLKKCLNSLINQTLKNIEIICVNDCSPDNCLSILREYEKKDRRIKIIDFKKNRGVSVARNEGMKIATGEYIGFVDSDDYIDLNFYEKLYKEARNSDADILKGEVKINKPRGESYKKNFGCSFLGKDKEVYLFFAFWSCIYRTSLVIENKITFPAGVVVGEDQVFLVKAMLLAKKIKLVDNVFYHYVNRKDSADTVLYDRKKLISVIRTYRDIFDFINTAKISKYDYLVTASRCCEFLLAIIFTKTNNNKDKIFVAGKIIELCGKMKREYWEDFLHAMEKNNKNLSFFLKNKNVGGLYNYCEEEKRKMVRCNFVELKKILEQKHGK